MKIIGGKFRGRNFFMPKKIRPTPDVIRKAVFDIMGQDLTGLSFLDLFAGSGAVGLEAISRNARYVVFVEKDSRCHEIIGENLATLQINAYTDSGIALRSLNADAFATVKQLEKKGERFDIAFADPPYYRELAKKALKALCAYDILQPVSYIILQHDKREGLPEHEGRFSVIKKRKYGASHVTIYQGKKS